MYISKIELHNIKCFEDATINLGDTEGNCQGCVILGENGVGKTTILRTIAMSLSGDSGSGLADKIGGGWIRDELKESYILVSFKLNDSNETFSLKSFFNKDSGGADVISHQDTLPDDKPFPWDRLFVAGYGASRGIEGSTQYDKYEFVDAVFTFFTPDSGYMQNPELVIRRIKDTITTNPEEKLQEILNWINPILMFPDNSITLTKGGLFVKDKWGIPRPISTIADGHQATLTMICDFLGWYLLYDDEAYVKGEKLYGVVIIDEIEQHLHPIWQRQIIKLLYKKFPKMQFIMTSHSPLVAGNAGKLFSEDEGLKLFYAGYSDGKSVVSEVEENLGELGYDQVLSSEAFGNISNLNINKEVEKLLMEASILAAKDQRTPEDNVKYDSFRKKLKELMFPEGRTLIERVVEREYYEEIQKKIDEFYEILGKKND